MAQLKKQNIYVINLFIFFDRFLQVFYTCLFFRLILNPLYFLFKIGLFFILI
jgi:hypothetical protein